MKDVCLIGCDTHQNIIKYIDKNLTENGFVSRAVLLNSQSGIPCYKLRNSKCVVFFVDKQFVLDEKCVSALQYTVKLAQKNKLYYFAVLMQGNSFDELINSLSADERKQNSNRLDAVQNAFPNSKLFVNFNNTDNDLQRAYGSQILPQDPLYPQADNIYNALGEICYSLSIHGLGAMRKRFVGFTAFALVLPIVLMLARVSNLTSFGSVAYAPDIIRYIFAISVGLSVALGILQFILYRKRVICNFIVRWIQFFNAFSSFTSIFSLVHMLFWPSLGDEPFIIPITLIYVVLSVALAVVCYVCVYKHFDFYSCYRNSDQNISVRREKYDIFISYSHKDMDKAEDLCIWLRRRGYKVLFDRSHMSAGDDWRQKANKFIQSSRCALFLVSDNSVRSNAVAEELRASLQRKQSQGGYTMLAVAAYDNDMRSILLSAGTTNEIKELYLNSALADDFYLMTDIADNLDGFCAQLKDKKIRQSKFVAITLLNVRVLVVNIIAQLIFWLTSEIDLAHLDMSDFSTALICIMLFVLILPLVLTVVETVMHALRIHNGLFSVIKSAKLFLTCFIICFLSGLMIMSDIGGKINLDAWWGYVLAIASLALLWLSPLIAFFYMRSRNRKYYKD